LQKGRISVENWELLTRNDAPTRGHGDAERKVFRSRVRMRSIQGSQSPTERKAFSGSITGGARISICNGAASPRLPVSASSSITSQALYLSQALRVIFYFLLLRVIKERYTNYQIVPRTISRGSWKAW
jgi:hypothetical protein